MSEQRLLIVDDNLLIRKRIQSIAERAGWHSIEAAEDGVEAIKAYRTQRPDLVTLDIVMPNMDGLQTLERLLEMDPQAQVVMVSAINQKPQLQRCIELGAMDFIIKPFDPQRLHDFFANVLHR